MAVPSEVNSGKLHIFGYAGNLKDACVKLQERLGGSGVPLTYVDLSKNPATFSNDAASDGVSKVAWLVGHGIKTTSSVYSDDSTHYSLTIQTIVDWLISEGYTHVVDTCCEPNRRKNVNKRGKVKYYCAADNKTVSENQNEASLDAWWDNNGMHEIV
jgi:hypothetical protein